MAAVVVRAWRGWWRFIHVAWEVHADAVAELTDGLRGWSLGTILFGLTLAGLTGTPEIVLEIGAALLMVYGIRVSLTAAGRVAVLDSSYVPPRLAHLDRALRVVEAAQAMVAKRNELHGNPSSPGWWNGWDFDLVRAVAAYNAGGEESGHG